MEGDYQGDNDYQDYMLPADLKAFITYFHRKIREKDVYDIHGLYEKQFNELTEKYFANQPWPPVEAIAPLVGNDQLFIVLYKEMYYRHIYAKLHPNLQHRFESFENYVDLFEHVLRSDTLDFDLPNQWLWDIVDEFIYQFQAFSQYRLKMKGKSQEEIQILKENPQVWNVRTILHYLESLVAKSDIVEILNAEKEGKASAQEVVLEHGQFHVWRMFGYFSLIGLCRVHCLLGDYYYALKSLDPLDLSKNKGLFSRITACHITLYYYLGFAYLMTRRYHDAIKAFSNIAIYISRTKNYHTRSYQYDNIMKKNDQIYGLLALTLALCPHRLDETIRNILRDKFGDKMARMQRGDEAAFGEVFTFACPKFISPAIPVYNDPSSPVSDPNEPLRIQLKLFLTEVAQQQVLPTLRSYMKLYTRIPIAKLATFFDDMDEKTLKTHLMCLKHKTRQLNFKSGESATTGKWNSSSDVDFYVDKDMVVIADQVVSKHYGDYFIRNIKKYEDLIADLNKVPSSTITATTATAKPVKSAQ